MPKQTHDESKKKPPRNRLKVLVTLPGNKLAKKATVRIKPSKGRSVALDYEPRENLYVSDLLDPDTYELTVSVRGYVKEKRAITMQSKDRRVHIYPGKEGMKAYYAAGTRIPFEPMNSIGVYLERGVGAKQAAELEKALGEKYKLESVPISDELSKGRHRFLLFRYGDMSGNEVAKVLRALSRRREVRHAGAAVKVGKRNARLLSDRIIVRFQAAVEEDRIEAMAKKYGLTSIGRPHFAGNARIFRSNDAGTYRILDTVAALTESEEVRYAEVDAFINVVEDLDPDDPYYNAATTPASNGNSQWHLPQCTVNDAWDITTGDTSIVVAVCDSGFEANHEDFLGKVYVSANLEPSGGVIDAYTTYALDTSHGMAVSGIAAAETDNATGVAGVAADCQIMGVNRPYSAYQSDIANMLVWVAGFDPVEVLGATTVFPTPPSPGADVIQNAYGIDGDDMDGIIQDAFDFVTTYGRDGKGCVVVYSSGNSGADFVTDPTEKRVFASYDKTIAVGACRQSEVWVTYSNYGSALDLVAPGGDSGGGPYIVTTTQQGEGHFDAAYSESLDYGDRWTDPDTDQHQVLGTSFSSPQVAGAAALMLSINPDLTWIQVRDILRETARQIDTATIDPLGQYDADGHAFYYGHGILDCAAAVGRAQDLLTEERADLYARDHATDDGTVPFGGSVFYLSPDLWNRQTHPASDDPIDYVNHENVLRGQPNYLWGRVTNGSSTADSSNFFVRFYVTHFPGTEFAWPDDFIPDATPSTVTTLAGLDRGTYLIGEYAHDGLAAGDSEEIWVEWPTDLIPPPEVDEGGGPVSWHPCILMEITPHDSEHHGSAPINVWDSNDLVQRNLTIDNLEDSDHFAAAVVVGHPRDEASWVMLEIDRGTLPKEVDLYARFGVDGDRKRALALIRDPRRAVAPDASRFRMRFDSRAKVTLMEDKACPVRLTMAKGTLLEIDCGAEGRPPSFEVTPAIWRDKPVFRLAARQKVRLPAWVEGGRHVPIIIEGKIPPGTQSGVHEIRLVQIQPDGRVAGGYGLRLRVK